MYYLDFIKFYVSITSYYVEVENGALLHDVTRSWKMIVRGVVESWKKFFGKKCGNLICYC